MTDLMIDGVRATLLAAIAAPDGTLKASGLRVSVLGGGVPGARYTKAVCAYLNDNGAWIATLGMAPQSAERHTTPRAAIEAVCTLSGFDSPWDTAP